MDKETFDAIMEIIIDVYYHMSEDELANWSLEQAKVVVSDQIKWDKERGVTPQPYDPEDFYDTIREFIELDEAECE